MTKRKIWDPVYHNDKLTKRRMIRQDLDFQLALVRARRNGGTERPKLGVNKRQHIDGCFTHFDPEPIRSQAGSSARTCVESR